MLLHCRGALVMTPQGSMLLTGKRALEYAGSVAAEDNNGIGGFERVGLGDRMDHVPSELSGGQQQRVAIARALVTDPKVLLADEPTGNLDSRTTDEVLAMLQWLNRERGLTIVMVTHEADVARCASRIVTVKDGLILSDEAVAEPRRGGASPWSGWRCRAARASRWTAARRTWTGSRPCCGA